MNLAKVILAVSLFLTGSAAIAGPINLRDQDFILPSDTSYVTTLNTFTAPRVITIPARAAYSGPSPLYIIDTNGSVSSTNTLTLVAQSGDLINGRSSFIITVPNTFTILATSPTGWTVTSGSFPLGALSVSQFGALGNTITISDGAINGSSALLCSAGLANFSQSDVGKYILIHGAGTAGAAFQSTISAFVSLHCVMLAANAVTTVSGASFTYGTDDTAAIQRAITSITNGGCLYFPAGAYWFGSQSAAISLANICLKGTAQSASALPYTNQGSVLVFTETASSEFTLGAGVTFDGLTFYYPAQDGSNATPVNYPPTLTGNNMFNFTFENNYVVNAYQLLKTTDSGSGSAIGRAYFHNNRIYAVDTAFYFTGGAADEISVDSTNIFSLGVAQDVTLSGSQNLANYTNTSGTVYKIDVGSASKASIDGLEITGAFHYGYRYGIRILSGLLDNSAIVGSQWDAVPTVLSVEGTTGKTDGLIFDSNWIYSLESFGSSPAAAAFNTINYTTSVNAGHATFTGNHFTFSQANFININAAALNSVEISSNTFATWGQSTTTGTYYAIVCSDSGLTCAISGNTFAAQTVAGSFQIGIDIVSKNQVNINGNAFNGAYYAIQDVSPAAKTNVVGNIVNGTVSSNAVNNGVSGTASILGCGNSFDKAPNVALTNGC
jgi:hypothetical protein